MRERRKKALALARIAMIVYGCVCICAEKFVGTGVLPANPILVCTGRSEWIGKNERLKRIAKAVLVRRFAVQGTWSPL